MQAELKRKWVEALRSGEYEQGKGFLCADDSEFCCLGVLLDVMDEPHDEYHTTGAVFRKYGNETLMLPPKIARNLGLREIAESDKGVGSPFRHHVIERRLAKMNDEGMSFNEIADWIEANVPVDDETVHCAA